jgi:membrane-associated protein
MDFLQHPIDFILHLDKYLPGIVQSLGPAVYVFLFLIIFCETGLVITPILPGDSLLFAVGALTADKILPYSILFPYILLTVAALLGDNSNYWIGRFGHNALEKYVNKKYLEQTHEFYERHGVLTLIIAQFAPIIRTFAPFVAGIGKMTYGKFVRLNTIGVVLWTTLFIWLGYFFGNIEIVKKNFEIVILGIVGVSFIPFFYQLFSSFKFKSKPAKPTSKKK